MPLFFYFRENHEPMKTLITTLALALFSMLSFAQEECPYDLFQEREHAFVKLPLSDTLDFVIGYSNFSLELHAHTTKSVVMTTIYGHRYEYEEGGLKIVFPIGAFQKRVAKKKFVRANFDDDPIKYAFVLRLDDEIILSENKGCFAERMSPWCEQ